MSHPFGNAPPPIADLIDAHIAAVQADEAQFDDAGNCLDDEAAERTLEAEQNAYRALCSAPCRSIDDVRAKIAYFVNGSIGQRTTLIDCLTDERYEPYIGAPNVARLLRSLIVVEG